VTGALILDFGGPVLRTPFELLRATERRLGLPPLTFDWRGPLDPDADPLWRRLRAGTISEPEYWAARATEFAAITGASGVRAMMREVFNGPEDEIVRSEATAAIRAARVLGCRVGILTNDLTLFHDGDWVAGIRVLEQVDAVVDAARLRARKPEAAAYRAALDALAVTAAEAVFVDDQPVNVDGAGAVGIPAVLFDVTRPAESYRRALALLPRPSGYRSQ
jgi:putative hydrolase of the HAD superfamily